MMLPLFFSFRGLSVFFSHPVEKTRTNIIRNWALCVRRFMCFMCPRVRASPRASVPVLLWYVPVVPYANVPVCPSVPVYPRGSVSWSSLYPVCLCSRVPVLESSCVRMLHMFLRPLGS